MRIKGKLNPPVRPIQENFKKVMDLIDSYDVGCAIFMVGGEVMSTKRTSRSFENNLKRLESGLVGVYEFGVDARYVLDDLKEFYREHA
jgi:hypothetical protein